MSFFKNIFKKKKGGTLVGNLLRSTASAYTGGILGQGANMLPLDDIQVSSQPTRQEIATKLVSKAGINELPQVKSTKTQVFIAGLKQNIVWVVTGIIVLIVGVWFFTKKGSRKKIK